MLQQAAPGPDQRTGGDPQNVNGASVFHPAVGTSASSLTLADILDTLGRDEGEYTAICHRLVRGTFSSSVVDSASANAAVSALPGDGNVWFSLNPAAGPARRCAGRGGEQQVTRLAALYLDVDVKDGAFPGLDKAAEYVTALSEMVGTRPSVLIYSGHGVQPVWPIDDGELDTADKREQARRLSRRFDRLARRVADDFSASLDNVSDLARILRVPGTTNWKDPAKPVPAYAVRDCGGPLTVGQVEEFLDAWSDSRELVLSGTAPIICRDQPMMGATISPVDGWVFGRTTCAYVAAMVRSWGKPSDEPRSGRHQWAMTRCVRLAAAYRLGCITQRGLHEALMVLRSALEQWCQVVGAPRHLAEDEVGSAYQWAEARVATFGQNRVRSELGHHQHSPVKGRMRTLVGR